MSSTVKEQSGVPTPVKIVIGIAFMVGGVFMSNKHIGSLSINGLDIDLGLSVATIGVFLILFPVIHLFYFSALHEAIHNRNSDLESTFGEAESLRSEMTKMKTEYEQRLASTEANAREQIQSQIKEAQTLRASLMSEAAEKADALKKQAEDEIAASKQKVLGELRTHVVDMAMLAAEKVVGENMDNAKNRKLVDDLISKAEVKA